MTNPSQPAQNSQEDRLNKILAEYMKRVDAGEAVDRDALLKEHPDLADGLRSYFQGEAMMGDPVYAATRLGYKGTESLLSRETLGPGRVEVETASEFSSRMLGRYQLLRPLGEGAMGSVYLAQDTTLDRRVALKIPKKPATGQPEFLARFTREARAAAGLKHPAICSVFDAGEIDGTAYITMDYIDGVPLSRHIGTPSLSSIESCLRVIRAIADAVAHAHSRGVIHRDLKPGNILLDDHLNPYVTDFGLARRESSEDGSRLTQEGLLIGTPAYMSPEQVRGEQSQVGPLSDLYSLGVILFEMLTSRLPFDGSVPEMLAKVLRDAPPVPSRLRKDIPESIDDLILKLLQKAPAQRIQSASRVIEAIDQILKTLPSAASKKNPAKAADQTKQASSPYEMQKAHLEIMIQKGQYATAIAELEKLALEKSPGAKNVAEWAQKSLPAVRAEARSLNAEGIAALLRTAEQMFSAFDYVGCIQLIEDVPALKRTDAMESLLQKAQRREALAEQLLEQIREKERQQDIDGLENLVQKLIRIKPGNSTAKRLVAAFSTYGSTALPRRKYHFEKGRLQPMPEASLFGRWIGLSLLVGALSFFSVSCYVIFYLKSGNQTLEVYVDDEWLKQQGGAVTLSIDGADHVISATTKQGEDYSVTVSFGEHTFAVKHGETIVHDPRKFEIRKEKKSVLVITPQELRLQNTPYTPPAPKLAESHEPTSTKPDSATKRETPQPDEGPTPTVVAMQADAKKEAMTTEAPMAAEASPSAPATRPEKMDTDDSMPALGEVAVAPFSSTRARQFQERWAEHLSLPVEYTNSIGMKFRLIPPGSFDMGSTQEQIEAARLADLDMTRQDRLKVLESEGPQQRITISRPFYLGVTEVTQAQFATVMGRQNSWYSKDGGGKEFVTEDRDNAPAEMMTWSETGEFCGRLTIHEALPSAYIVTPEKIQQTGIGGYRLPTDAEWEYACRAGTTTLFWSGDDEASLLPVAITNRNADGKPPAIVGQRPANPFGLFDMHGNCGEWVHDAWQQDHYQSLTGPRAVDPRNDGLVTSERIIRGGSFWTSPAECRSASRYPMGDGTVWIETGFRVALSVDAVRDLISRTAR